MSKKTLQDYRQDKVVWMDKYERARQEGNDFDLRRASAEIQRINKKITELTQGR